VILWYTIYMLLRIGYYIITIVTLFLFTSCGGGGGSGDSIKIDPVKSSADFIDAPVQGIEYSCSNSSTSGKTNENGTFDYDDGCGTITFKIGGVSVYSKNISQIPSDKKLYITDLVGVDRTDTNNSKVLDIARFIQSLDDDNNPYNGINITPAIAVELASSTIDFATTPSISDLNDTITSLGKTLVDEDDAKAHFTYTLNNDLSLDIDSPPPPAPTLTIIPTMSNENNITVEVNGQPKTTIFLNGADTNTTIPEGLAKVSITLDTSGSDGDFDFNITLQDPTDQFSDPLLFTIRKDTVAPSITTSSIINISENNTILYDINATDATVSPLQDLSYTITGGIDKNYFEINSSTGVVSYLASIDYENPTDHNKDNTYLFEVTVSDGINSDTQNITLNVQNIAEIAPTLNSFSASVLEDADNNTTVGTISFDMGDTNITSFELNNSNGTTQSIFSVNNQGIISVNDNSTLDYDDGVRIYTLIANATNDFGVSNTSNIIISVVNVNDVTPTLQNFSTTLNENSTANFIVGYLNVISGDTATNNITLKETNGTTSDDFLIAQNGTISVKSGATLDYETRDTYNLRAIAYNSSGASNEVNVSISLNNLLNERVPNIDSASGSIDENATSNTIVTTIAINDMGDSNISSFTINGVGAGNFDINSSGTVKLKTGASLDYETTPSYTLTVYATNEAGNSNNVNVEISVGNIAEIKPILSAFTGSVSEGASLNTTIGTVSVSDGGDTPITDFNLTELNGSNQSLFTINSSGVITLAQADVLDYETKPLHTLNVTATNDKGTSDPVTVTINITNTTDTKPTLAAFSGTLDENSVAGTIVGNLVISDSGDSAITQIDLNETNGSLSNTFEISTTGVIKVKSGVTLDYDLGRQSYELHATAINSAGSSNSVDVNISINNLLNEIKPKLNPFSGSVIENATANTLIGSIDINTSGDSNISSFSLSGNGAGNFEVNSSGSIKVASGASINYEDTTQFILSVYATNDAGNSPSVAVVIDVNNTAEIAPTLSAFTGSISENADINDTVGTISFTSGDTAITDFNLTSLGSLSSIFSVDNDGIIKVLDNSSLDYESTKSYTLNAQAKNDANSSNIVTVTINVLDVTDATPIISNFTGSINENSPTHSVVGSLTINSNGDSAITHIDLNETNGSISNEFEILNTGLIRVKSGAILDYDTSPNSYNLRAIAYNSSGASNEVNVSISLNNLLNEVVPSLNPFSGSIDENITEGSFIGNMDINSSGDSNISSFSISGVGAGLFDINSSGAIKIATNASFDYETTTSYTLSVYATNDAGNSPSVAVVIDVNNTPEIAPTLSAFTGSINENASNGDIVGTISFTSGDTAINDFNLTESNGSLSSVFTINNGGVITVQDSNSLDADGNQSSYTLNATAANSFGASSSVTVIISINNITDTPPTISNFTGSINENSLTDAIVGNLIINSTGDSAITHIDLNETNGSVSNEFKISTTGVIQVKAGAILDYDTSPNSYNLRAIAYNSSGASNEVNVSISLNNLLNERVPNIDSASGSIDENATSNTIVTTIAINDMGDSNISSFTINGVGAGNFDINSSGTVKLKTGASLDYETTPSYTLTVYATNEAGNSNNVNVEISVGNIAEIKPILSAFTGSVSEGASLNTTIGTVSVSDGGDTPITDFNLTELNGSNQSLFTINSSGVITLAQADVLDYETKPLHTLNVTATNDKGTSDPVTVTINIDDIIDELPKINDANFTINENVPSLTNVGNLVVYPGDSAITNIVLRDQDTNTTSQYFDVSTTGVVSVKFGATIDYESNASYSLFATATNSFGNSNEANITISINDLQNEIKPILTNFTTSIDENISTVGYHVGDINITNILNLDSNISNFTLTGTGAANFEINSSGAVLLADGFTLDYETTPIYYLTLTATNLAGTSDSVNVRINVNNIAEVVPVLQPFIGSINEADDINTTIGTILFTQGDSNITRFDLNESNGSTQNLFSIDTNGIIKLNLANGLDYETKQTYNLLATATNSAGVSSPVTATINITNSLDTKPTIQGFSGSVNENSSGGTTLGNLIILDIGDSPITHFDINNSNGSISNEFEISSTGVIKVKSGASLDFETTTQYTLTTTAYNAVGASNPVDVNITILDIAEVKPILESITITIDENITTATLVADFNATNTMDSNITTFTLLGDGAGNFEINSTGHVIISNDASIDFESKESYSLTVTATNNAGTSNPVNLNVNINDIPDIKPVIENFTGNIHENATVGTVVIGGSINIVTSGDSPISLISLKEVNNTISTNFTAQTNGTITVKSNAILDYESRKEHNLTAIATNTSGDSNEVNVTIYVIDLAEKVPELNTTTGSVDENATAGTYIMNVPIIDEGDTSITKFSLTGTGAGNFEINTTGHIKVANGANLNFEAIEQYNLEAFATNTAGDSATVNIIININDISEIPPVLLDTTLSLREDAVAGNSVGDLNISTKGDSNFTSCSVGGSDASSFIIDTNGVVKVSSGTTFDYVSKQQYSITAKCSNEANWSNEVNVTINITDVAQVLPVMNATTLSVKETEPKGTTIGQISIDAGDTAITEINITTATNTHENNFEILPDGTINLSNTADLNASARSIYQFYVKAYNSLGESNATLITINIIAVENLYIQSAIYDDNETNTVEDDVVYLYFNKSIKESTLNNDISDDFVLQGSGAIGTGVAYNYSDAPYKLLQIESAISASSIQMNPNDTKIAIAFEEITDADDTYVKSYIYTSVQSLEYLPKTGQSNSYDSTGTLDGSIKDDGYYESGIDHNFTRDNTNNIVYDHVQKLIWDDKDMTTLPKNWHESQDYCSDTNNFIDKELSLRAGWRVPTLKELSFLIDRDNINPSINSTFQNTINGPYWTINENVNNTNYGWLVLFSTGTTYAQSSLKTKWNSPYHYVRCVRDQ
jgi:hypothetical protein